MKASAFCVLAASAFLAIAPAHAGEWLPSGNAERLGFDQDRLDRIALVMQSHVESGRLPGAVMVIVRDGKVIYRESVGYADMENAVPMDEDVVFRIYSMTKAVTTVAAMILVEEGKLRLTDPVSKFIPAFANTKVYVSGDGEDAVLEDQNTVLTVHHLLTHTAGIPYGGRSPAMSAYNDVNQSGAETLEQFANVVAPKPLVFQPGERWLYGFATDIVGRVVEVAAGQPFEDFLDQRIIEPLGMDDTSFTLESDMRPRLAVLYQDTYDGLKVAAAPGQRPYELKDTIPSGGAGLFSTASDYLRFAQMLLNGGALDGVRILSPRSVELMSRNHLNEKQRFREGMGFGLGFGITEDPGIRQTYLSVGTYYWAGAADTHFWIDPEKNVIGLAMTQLFSNRSPLRDDMRVMTYQALID